MIFLPIGEGCVRHVLTFMIKSELTYRVGKLFSVFSLNMPNFDPISCFTYFLLFLFHTLHMPNLFPNSNFLPERCILFNYLKCNKI